MSWDRPHRDERQAWAESVERDWITHERNERINERWDKEPREDPDPTDDDGSES